MAKKLNVLILAPDLSTLGGKQSYFLAVKDHFGHHIEFFTYGARGKKEGKVGRALRMLTDYRHYWRELKSGKWDVVHVNPSMNRNSFFRDSMFMYLAKLAGVKTVVFWHGWGWDFVKKTLPKNKGWFGRTFARANASIILANEFRPTLEEYGVEGPVHLETTVVDDYLTAGVTPESIEHKLNQDDPLNLLFLARVEVAKGIYECLEAYEKLKPEFPQLRLLIAGNGGEFEGMKAHISERALTDVEVLGFINGEEKREVFHRSHIYLFPSTYGEGLPCSLLEAMNCGMPLVTTGAGGIKDYFEDGQMGYMLRDRDTGEVESAIRKLLADPELRLKMARYNYAYANENFTAEKVTARLEKIYESVAGLTPVPEKVSV